MKSAGGILVVDDDPDLREFLRLMLTSMGFEVTSAANGQEALDDMKGHDPDLILLDMKMHAEGWLGKPFEYADLQAMVRRFAKSPAR